MKRGVNLLIGLLLAICNNLYGSLSNNGSNPSPGDSVNILSTPDLCNLSMKWAEAYNRKFPGAKIKIITVSDPEKAGNLINSGDLGFISNDFYLGLKNPSLWKVVVGRDVIVPVINAKNPLMEEICKRGVSPEGLSALLKNGKVGTWGNLLKDGTNEQVDYYCIDDESARGSLAEFLKIDKSNIGGRNSLSPGELISTVQKDPYAIGFCKLINVLDFKNQVMADNIRLLPIDRNGNGIIDFNEKIYNNINDFTRGVWIGKYPKSLYSNIYTVSFDQPEKPNEVAFIKWVLSEGQAFLPGNGYTDLLVSERQSAGDKLYNAKIDSGVSTGEKSLLKSFFFIIATVILIGLIVTTLAKKRKRVAAKITGSTLHQILDEQSLKIPKGIYFDKTHTWAFLEENGIVKVGIDDFLQHITGRITRIKMKSPGKKVKKGEQILSLVQNGKQLNLYAPVSGTIVEQNMLLETNSSALNSAPYKEGWIYRIEPSNWSRESQLLFMADKQKEFISKEFLRLKDFLMTALASDTERYAQVMLQDGGEINDGVLSEMGPEIWEDFQTNFIDPSRQVWFYEMF